MNSDKVREAIDAGKIACPFCANRKLLKIDIRWRTRKATVTSLVGGHIAKCWDLGDKMTIEISGSDTHKAQDG